VTSAVSGEATVAEAFLRMFVETCGHYDAYINTQQDGEKIFQVRGIAAFHILSVATHSDRSATHPAKSHTSHV